MTDLPEAFSADGEPVRYLLKYKSSLERRLRQSRMEDLFGAVDLGFYLTALQRPAGALEVVSFLSDHIVFDGNDNVWTPAGYGICLQARLSRLNGNHQAAHEVMERIRVHPFQVSEAREQVTERIASLPPKIEEAYQTTSRKWSCHRLARTLYNVCFYHEAAVHGLIHAEWVPVEALEVLMQGGLEKLGERLQ